MKRLIIGSGALLLIALLSVSGHSVTSRSEAAENVRQDLAIELLQSINTAELDYKLKHGLYANWDTLVANGDYTNQGTKWASKNGSLANLEFSKNSEIVPGWKLRLNVTADSKAYDLLLEDSKDETCGYAAITDERGVIRQGKTIDCKL